MFVHLRLHTEFSVVDGTNRIEEVIRAAAADGQPALAITDLNNLFGAIKFYKEARTQGVKPLLGAEVWVEGVGADASVTQMISIEPHCRTADHRQKIQQSSDRHTKKKAPTLSVL